jgi:probable addiction module antidote protein
MDERLETYAPFDIAEHLESEELIVAFLETLLAEGSAQEVAAGLGHVARARGMAQIACNTGVSQESLNRILFGDGNPEFATIINVIRALGIRLVPVSGADLNEKTLPRQG